MNAERLGFITMNSILDVELMPQYLTHNKSFKMLGFVRMAHERFPVQETRNLDEELADSLESQLTVIENPARIDTVIEKPQRTETVTEKTTNVEDTIDSGQHKNKIPPSAVYECLYARNIADNVAQGNEDLQQKTVRQTNSSENGTIIHQECCSLNLESIALSSRSSADGVSAALSSESSSSKVATEGCRCSSTLTVEDSSLKSLDSDSVNNSNVKYMISPPSGSSLCTLDSGIHQPECDDDAQQTKLLEFLASRSHEDVNDKVSEYSNSLRNSAGSSYFSSESICPECEEMNTKFPCDLSYVFWNTIPLKGLTSNRCHQKSFNAFLDLLKTKFPNDEKMMKRTTTMNCLKTLLNIDLKDATATIEYKDFYRVCLFFGPVREDNDGHCILLSQIDDIARNSLQTKRKTREKISWFAGDMSREQAEEKLSKQPDDTFLIRMSGSDEGDFAVSVKDKNVPKHFKIKRDCSTAATSKPYSACLSVNEIEFASLVSLVKHLMQSSNYLEDEENEKVYCTTVCPGLPLNGVISGYR